MKCTSILSLIKSYFKDEMKIKLLSAKTILKFACQMGLKYR